MSYTCPSCGETAIVRRNGLLQCARCGAPAQFFSPEEELGYEQNMERGRALLRARRYDEAAPVFRQIRQSRPGSVQAYLCLAEALTRGYSNFADNDEALSALFSARALGSVLPGEAQRWMQDLLRSAETDLLRRQEQLLGVVMLSFLALAAFWVFVALAKGLFCVLAAIGFFWCLSKISPAYRMLQGAKAHAQSLRSRLHL